MTMQITCIDCGCEFTLTEGEQAFFITKGFKVPKRCKNCREKNKSKKNEIDSSKVGCKTSSFFGNTQIFGMPIEVHGNGGVAPVPGYMIRVCSNGKTSFLQFSDNNKSFRKVVSEQEATCFRFSPAMQDFCDEMNIKHKDAIYDIFPDPDFYR